LADDEGEKARQRHHLKEEKQMVNMFQEQKDARDAIRREEATQKRILNDIDLLNREIAAIRKCAKTEQEAFSAQLLGCSRKLDDIAAGDDFSSNFAGESPEEPGSPLARRPSEATHRAEVLETQSNKLARGRAGRVQVERGMNKHDGKLTRKLVRMNTTHIDLVKLKKVKQDQTRELKKEVIQKKEVRELEQRQREEMCASFRRELDEMQVSLAKLAFVACAQAGPPKREVRSREISRLMSRGRIVGAVKDPAPTFGTLCIDLGSTGDSWFKRLSDLRNTGESFFSSKAATAHLASNQSQKAAKNLSEEFGVVLPPIS
jgi:hypothetical protein